MVKQEKKSAGKKKQQSLKMKWMGRYAIALMLFSLLCLGSSLYLNTDIKQVFSGTISYRGGIIGPIEIAKDKTVLNINIEHRIRNKEWSYITGELLDANKGYLFAFGKELWFEEGRDSDGYWSEGPRELDMKITVQQKGKYFLRFSTESSQKVNRNIRVIVERKKGSALVFMWIGILTLLLGIILNEVSNRTVIRILAKLEDD